jgi:hypothetical protein
VRGHCVLGRCVVEATCVRDQARGEPPDGRRGSSSTPGCGRTWGLAHGTPAERTMAAREKILLRDHAPPQPPWVAVLAAKWVHADGAHVRLRRAGLGPPRPDAVGPAAAPPANAAADADSPGLGSTADSNTAAGIGVHNPCAGKSAPAVVADWSGSGTGAYDDGSPRECDLPRDSPGGTRFRSPRALMTTGQRLSANLYFRAGTKQRRRRLENGAAKETKDRPATIIAHLRSPYRNQTAKETA